MAKVFILGSYAPSLTNFRGSLIRELREAGHEVLTAAPDLEGEVRKRLESWGVRCFLVPMRRHGLNPLEDLRTLSTLVALLRRERPEVFLGYTIKPVLYGVLAARLARVPRRYAMITGLGFAFSGESLARRLVQAVAERGYRLGLGFCQQVLFQNPDDLKVFRERRLLNDPSKAVLINGSGVDVEHFRPEPLPQEVSFLLIARLLRDKGVREFVEAARKVRRDHPQVRFRLVGWLDDSPSSITQAEVDGWVNEGTVEFLGRLEDVRPAIAQSTVFVLPSYREGTPRTVLEAMAMGRAVITTSAPGCRETVVDEDNGFLVPVRDAEALAQAMRRFLENPTLAAQMGARGRAVAEAKYDVRKVNRVIREAMELL